MRTDTSMSFIQGYTVGSMINLLWLSLALLAGSGCQARPQRSSAKALHRKPPQPKVSARVGPVAKVIRSALQQTGYTHSYDPSYISIAYPNGDVPRHTGVCSDVVVRALRSAGVDLQKLVHEDIKKNFRAYPSRWGLKRPDRNIDHRRVANLMMFLSRRGKSVKRSNRAEDYLPGDIIAWRLFDNRLHIGVVSDRLIQSTGRHLVVHNIGYGARAEDVISAWPIIGHYRYFRGG